MAELVHNPAARHTAHAAVERLRFLPPEVSQLCEAIALSAATGDVTPALVHLQAVRALLDDAEGYLRYGYAGWEAKRGSHPTGAQP